MNNNFSVFDNLKLKLSGFVVRLASVALLLIAAVVTIGFVSACSLADGEVDEIQREIDKVKDEDIASIEEQKAAIEATADNFDLIVNNAESYLNALDEQSKNLQSSIDALDSDINAVRKELEDSVAGVKSTLLAHLEAIKTSLEAELDGINEAIADLQKADATLSNRIDSLNVYVDEKIDEYKSWTEATFATLEQMKFANDDVAALKSAALAAKASAEALGSRLDSSIDAAYDDLDDVAAAVRTEISNTLSDVQSTIADAEKTIAEEYNACLKEHVAASEATIKSFVNEQLTGYYTASELTVKLDSLEAAMDVKLASQKAELKELIASVAAELNKTIDANTTLIATLRTDLTTFQSKQDAEYQKILDYDNAIVKNAALIKANADSIAANADDIAKARELISTNNSLIKANETALSEIESAIAAIKSSPDEIDQVHVNTLESIRKNAEDIASQLETVNDNAEIIADQASAISDNAAEIIELRTMLAEEEEAITAAYKQAIADAISTSEGKVGDSIQQIAVDIKSKFETVSNLLTEIEDSVSNIEDEIKSIKDTFAEIKQNMDEYTEKISDLINRIQSMVYLPIYSDGSLTVEYTSPATPVAEMDFKIQPSGLAKVLADNASALTASVITGSSSTEGTVLSATSTGDILTVRIQLPAITGQKLEQTSQVALHVSDGNNDRLSDYVKTYVRRTFAETNTMKLKYSVSAGSVNLVNSSAVTSIQGVTTGLGDLAYVDYGDGECGTDYSHVYGTAGDYDITFYTNSPIEYISDNTFKSVKELVGIESYPPSLNEIGTYAFFGTSLKELVLPDRAITLGTFSFGDITTFDKVIVPQSIVLSPSEYGAFECIVANTFHVDCELVDYVNRGNSMITFYDAQINELTIGEHVTRIGNYSFYHSKIKNFLFETTQPITIGDGAFALCKEVEQLNLPEVQSIEGSFAFCIMPKLKSITVVRGKFWSNNGVLYGPVIDNMCGLVRYPEAKEGDSYEDSGCAMIAPGAFRDCINLKTIQLATHYMTAGIPDYAFMGCTNLAAITYKMYYGYPFSYGVSSIRGTGLKTFEIQVGCESIENYAFEDTELDTLFVSAVTPPTLASEALPTNDNLVIAIIPEYLDAYKTAEGWSEYADKMVAWIDDDNE